MFAESVASLNWAVSSLNIQANPAEQSHLPVGAASSWNGPKLKEVNSTPYIANIIPGFTSTKSARGELTPSVWWRGSFSKWWRQFPCEALSGTFWTIWSHFFTPLFLLLGFFICIYRKPFPSLPTICICISALPLSRFCCVNPLWLQGVIRC